MSIIRYAVGKQKQPHTFAYNSSNTFVPNNTMQDSMRVLHFCFCLLKFITISLHSQNKSLLLQRNN